MNLTYLAAYDRFFTVFQTGPTCMRGTTVTWWYSLYQWRNEFCRLRTGTYSISLRDRVPPTHNNNTLLAARRGEPRQPIFRSTSKSRPNNIREGEKCPSVRPSTKSFFDLNEIWCIGRGRWVMHDGMPYGPIQGQGQGHEPLKIWIPSIFKTYLLRHLQWELVNDHQFLN